MVCKGNIMYFMTSNKYVINIPAHLTIRIFSASLHRFLLKAFKEQQTWCVRVRFVIIIIITI